MVTTIKESKVKKTPFELLVDSRLTIEEKKNISMKTGVAIHNFTKVFKRPYLAKNDVLAALSIILKIHPWILIRDYGLGKARLSDIEQKVWELSFKSKLAKKIK